MKELINTCFVSAFGRSVPPPYRSRAKPYGIIWNATRMTFHHSWFRKVKGRSKRSSGKALLGLGWWHFFNTSSSFCSTWSDLWVIQSSFPPYGTLAVRKEKDNFRNHSMENSFKSPSPWIHHWKHLRMKGSLPLLHIGAVSFLNRISLKEMTREFSGNGYI